LFHLEQDTQNRADRICEAEKDCQNKTSGTGLPGQDRQNRIARNRIARNRIARNRIARNRIAKNRIARNKIARNRIARTILPRQYCPDRTVRTGLPGQGTFTE
jgi:hypothetical protein